MTLDIKDQKLLDHLSWNSYLSERSKLLYVATPKVACTSLKWWFANLEGLSDALFLAEDSSESSPELVIHDTFHKVAPNITGLNPEALSHALKSEEYFRFAVVRNPYKRIFSAWQSKLLLREPLQIQPYISCDFYSYPIENASDIAKAFEAFLEHLAANETANYWDIHWTPQADLLRPDLISYTKISQIENVKELNNALAKHLGQQYTDPFASRSSNESLIPYLPELITDRAGELIRLLYAKDFELFGYNKSKPDGKEEFSSKQMNVALKAVDLIRGRHQRIGEISAERDKRVPVTDSVLMETLQQLEKTRQEHNRIVAWSKELNTAISERDKLIAQHRKSLCWRMGAPIRRARAMIGTIKIILKAIPSAISYYDSIPTTLRRTLVIIRREGIKGIKRKARVLIEGEISINNVYERNEIDHCELYGMGKIRTEGFTPKVSIIVPNFNHKKYLRKRLDSIYRQSYSNYEVILLDDASSDGSVEILKEYAARFSDKTITCFNEVNSGGVFNQWKKGFELATGELIWIAESDDYCTTNLLEELVQFFDNSAVMLAFTRTDFVRGESSGRIWTSERYLADLNLDCWKKPFIKSANWLVNNGWAIKNIVPNVSSAVFRNPGRLSLIEEPAWKNLRLCGDWIFYLTIIRGGLVAYSPNATNYYRQHPQSTSINTQKEDTYYREHESVAMQLLALYKLKPDVLERQEKYLYAHWQSSRGNLLDYKFKALYDLKRASLAAKIRKPNIVMCVYALAAGGGETFPIMLANLLSASGYCVTLFNSKQAETEIGIRNMLDRRIPLLELDRLELISASFEDIGAEIVHSHHAWLDIALSTLLMNSPEIKQVVTMHGMYEMMTPAQIKNHLPLLNKRIDRFVYTAEKNLPPFHESFREEKGFIRIDNALASSQIQPISRSEFGIEDDDFVLCLVARAIPEKGWNEAINAVEWANAHLSLSKRIHLLIIGEGPEFERLGVNNTQSFVHFLGFRSNIRDYFSMSDMGFLPSRFRGECYPLVLIDSLHAGRPVLASNIGEIENMLTTDEGLLAGALFDLVDWEIPVEEVGRIILTLAEDEGYYRSLLSQVPKAACKFDPLIMLNKYADVYQSLMQDKLIQQSDKHNVGMRA